MYDLFVFNIDEHGRFKDFARTEVFVTFAHIPKAFHMNTTLDETHQ